MKIYLSEEEACYYILVGLGLSGDASIKRRGELHILNSEHEVVITKCNPWVPPSGINPSPFHIPSVTCEAPDSCYTVDGVPDIDMEVDCGKS